MMIYSTTHEASKRMEYLKSVVMRLKAIPFIPGLAFSWCLNELHENYSVKLKCSDILFCIGCKIIIKDRVGIICHKR